MKIPWFPVRLVLMALGFLASLCVGLTHPVRGDELDVPPSIVTLFALPVAVPICLLIVVGVQAVIPFGAKVWTTPTQRANPFNLREPLLFFHFAGFFVGASGLGFLAASAGYIPWLVFRGLGESLGAIGLLVGVEICQRVFKKQYAAQELSGAGAGLRSGSCTGALGALSQLKHNPVGRPEEKTDHSMSTARWLEFHGSKIIAVHGNPACVCVELDGYIHQWEGSGSSRCGTGWVQRVVSRSTFRRWIKGYLFYPLHCQAEPRSSTPYSRTERVGSRFQQPSTARSH